MSILLVIFVKVFDILMVIGDTVLPSSRLTGPNELHTELLVTSTDQGKTNSLTWSS